MANEITTAIDIGSHSVYTLIAQKKEDLLPQIIGVGSVRSNGIRKGVVVDIGDAQASIADSIRIAERGAGVKVSKATEAWEAAIYLRKQVMA